MTNWTQDYDSETLDTMYQEITDYFTETITSTVLEKYHKSVDNNNEKV